MNTRTDTGWEKGGSGDDNNQTEIHQISKMLKKELSLQRKDILKNLSRISKVNSKSKICNFKYSYQVVDKP